MTRTMIDKILNAIAIIVLVIFVAPIGLVIGAGVLVSAWPLLLVLCALRRVETEYDIQRRWWSYLLEVSSFAIGVVLSAIWAYVLCTLSTYGGI